MNMAFLWNNSSAYRILIVIAVIAVLYVLFISGLSTNPPGFYMDESCLSYNGYLIAHTGAGEMGNRPDLVSVGRWIGAIRAGGV